jgi:hypothetical protein
MAPEEREEVEEEEEVLEVAAKLRTNCSRADEAEDDASGESL